MSIRSPDLPAAEPAPAAPRSGRLAAARLLPSWPLLVGLAVLARLLASRLALLHDPDTYLHIAAGRWMLAHAALPLHDPFSHTLPGAAWIPPEWLAEVVLAAAYDGFGWGGVILLTAAAAALAVGLLVHFLLRRLEPLPALVAAAAAVALLEPHLLARPHILALPLLVAWSGLLLAARDAGRPPPFAVLPLMALWANLHGSFLFGLAFAAFLAGEAVWQPDGGRSRLAAARLWGGFVAAGVVAALITPHGVAGLLQPFRLMQMPALQSSFVEWLSPDFQRDPAFELWIVGLVALGFATGARLPWPRLVLLLGLVHMALQHNRHGDVLAIAAPLALAAPLGARLAALAATPSPSRLRCWAARLAQPPGVAGVGLTVALAAAVALPLTATPLARPDDAVTPAAALAEAQRLGLTNGPVFNSEGLGGYLIFRGVPTFIDGRIEMYGNDFLATDVAAERGDPAALKRLLARYRVTWTLLMPQAGAVAVMDRLPGWQRAYADKYAVIHRHIAPP